ncbi:hypothetical protein MHZ95_15180 [Sporosarcina sp. ACRSM]|uniref:SWIM zinc finger family protein n=1 Tax=Sporosarcina sp. ACRSM TaxID=2918216 RepID=UPI001EF60777|nr:hypothetical protein [Sporosarcina sp. ACRSM]MCG7336612.1 hypothetical protein [Sporosarcina sp. ACRSM]
MNIENFEEHISEKILERGYDYYADGHVGEAVLQGEHEYVFQVIGSDDYVVVVKMDTNGEIIWSDCDCPYDYGPVCKHEAAVFYELFKILHEESGERISMNGREKQPELRDVLEGLSKEELVEIIMEFAGNDAILKSRLLLKYSKGETGQALANSKRWIRSVVNKYTAGERFISYRETGRFTRELGECLTQIENCANASVALDLAFLLLEETISAFQYADDSNGDIGFLVEETLEAIEETVIEAVTLKPEQSGSLLEKLLKQCDHPIFDGWEDYRIALFRICTQFADQKEYREILNQKIESMIDEKDAEHHRRYVNEELLQILFEMIQRYGNKEEAERFIHKYLHYTSFREWLIQQNMAGKNYEQVIQLALAGEKQDKGFAGLVSKWKQFRYAAYKELTLKDEQQTLAKELFLNGDFEYYAELKELAENHAQFYAHLKQELQKETGWRAKDLFKRLIEEENDIAEMMELVRENPKPVEQYTSELVGSFKDEIQQIYAKYIKMAAHAASDRRRYQDVCRIIQRFEKVAGKNLREELVKELRDVYKRKPAFLDELSKI